MKLTILGTGNAGVIECYNTCFALSDDHRHFLVDTGGGNGILKQLNDSNIPLNEIHDIFITHEHADHILGIVWLIRMIGTQMNQGKYEGKLRIYCHSGLVNVIETFAKMTIQKKVTSHIGQEILIIPLESGDCHTILDRSVTFFDIASTKARQFGFTMLIDENTKFTCCGDEPYNAVDEEYVQGSTYLMHEAFCLFSQADQFKPYEKHHSTVKEACELAESMHIPNLFLYHTEEKNLKNRKELYTAEGTAYYHGNLYVPDDLDTYDL